MPGRAAGIATGAWMPANTRDELAQAAAALGLPCVAKTTRLGYDGRGQFVLRREEDVDAAWEKLAPHALIVEAFIDFACEVSVIVARGEDGAMATFDPVENRHRNHI